MEKSIYYKVHSAIKDIWIYDIKDDYENSFLLKEDTLKNAFYFHLRNRLGDSFLRENQLAIFTEYYIDTKQKIDLVVVRLDVEKAQNEYLGNCIDEVVAVVEMKYKGKYAKDQIFMDDVDKTIAYVNKFKGEATKFFLAFIREKYFAADEVENFLAHYQNVPKGKIVELLSYWISDDDSVVWKVIEH
ncbi:hypothetical protein [Solibacillus daqui]|uniref:hypothetical protein n=1 Tax=Solibacillus daqui TaxID=2912187 RepID=UPI0023653E30|nr:hypothetical protein [Solibacillus daqui]